VVVIDDDVNEGMAIVSALSKYGMGISFFTGDPDELPLKRLDGVRLLVLDMNLTTIETGTIEETLSPLITFLDKLLAKNSKPFVILAWTKHSELVNKFGKMLDKVRPDLKPYFMAKLQKASYKEQDTVDKYNSKKIRQSIRNKARKWFPLDLLMEWEQRVHDAASETTTMVTEISGASSSTWSEETGKVLSTLALESGGQQLGKGERAITSLFRALGPIHEDCLETLAQDTASLSCQEGKLSKEIEAELKSREKDNKPRLSSSQCAKLNRLLNIAQVRENAHAARPGSVFFKDGWGEKDKNKLFNIDETSPRVKEMMKKLPQDSTERNKIISQFFPILVEITPPCDYSQDKTCQIRLISGLLVPHDLKKYAKENAEFVFSSGPLAFEKSIMCPAEGDYYLNLNSRYVTGIDKVEVVDSKEAYRIRKQLLTDILAWFGRQAARPGHISLRYEL
jgi:hypothetical protein